MSIAFNGGTSEQQTAIRNAHGHLASALGTAKSTAQSGGGSFATWFGQAGSSAQNVVSGVFTTVADNLESVNFTYDLTNWLPSAYVPGLCLFFTESTATTASVSMWQEYWDAFALYAGPSSIDLQQALFQQMALAYGTDLTYYGSVDNAAEAALIAAADPATALVNITAYSNFLAQFLSASS